MTQQSECLADHVLLRSTDPDEVRHEAEGLLAGHGMRCPGAIRADIRGVEIGRSALLRFSYGTEVEIEAEPLVDLATIHVPLAGGLDLAHGGRHLRADTGTGAVISPESDLRMRWRADLSLLVVRLDRTALRDRMASILGEPVADGPFGFDPVLEVRGAGAGLVGAVNALRRAVDAAGPGGLPHRVAAEFERTILTLLLLSQPHRRTARLGAPGPPPTPRVVRVVVDHIEAHTGRFFSVAELASVAGIGERTLVDAFRRHLDTTPSAYLRAVRLDAAYRDLEDAHGGATVTEIALRNGFAHLGRFADHFRRRFGVTPRDVLRR